MKRIAILAFGALMLGLPALPHAGFAQSAVEATQTETTFYIENMTCALCPITVKAAMGGVKGVKSVEIDFPARTAHVVFDPGLTDTAAIAKASELAGYPAAAKG